ncbi:hypothetical protein B5S29_g2595 [[Candida] boidinii]|nr:hypothetical protein B5S29_g2595 [[Candida] boidinii]
MNRGMNTFGGSPQYGNSRSMPQPQPQPQSQQQQQQGMPRPKNQNFQGYQQQPKQYQQGLPQQQQQQGLPQQYNTPRYKSPLQQSQSQFGSNLNNQRPPPPYVQTQQVRQVKVNHQKSGSTSSMDLARQYESDKAEIVKCLFSEIDPNDGQRIENYLTHVRIIEDSRFPSSRPPANSPTSNKKPRFLILSSKPSGRVRLHKARENSDGSIQIGRTWDFDEWTRLELDKEVPTGFLVDIGKRYYWETNTPKERRVFCGMLLNFFQEYMGNKIPELVNCSLEYFHLDSASRSTSSPRSSLIARRTSANNRSSPLSPSKNGGSSFNSPSLLSNGSQFDNKNLNTRQRTPVAPAVSNVQPPRPAASALSFGSGLGSDERSGSLVSSNSNGSGGQSNPHSSLSQKQYGHDSPASTNSKLNLGSTDNSPLKQENRYAQSPKKTSQNSLLYQQQEQEVSTKPLNLGSQSYTNLLSDKSRQGTPAGAEIQSSLPDTDSSSLKRRSHKRRSSAKSFDNMINGPDSGLTPFPSDAKPKTIEETTELKTLPLNIPKVRNAVPQSELDTDLAINAGRPTSIASIEFVTHKITKDEIEETITLSGKSEHGKDSGYHDETDDFYNSYPNANNTDSSHVAPLNVVRSGSALNLDPPTATGNTNAFPNSSRDDFSFEMSKESLVPDQRDRSRLNADSTLKSEILIQDDTLNISDTEEFPSMNNFASSSPSSNKINTLLPPSAGAGARTRGHARTRSHKPEGRASRAFSRADTQDKKNEITDLFDEINWGSNDDSESLKKKLRNELQQIESERIIKLTTPSNTTGSLADILHKSLEECDIIEPILSLFGVELSSFSSDINHIEKQGHGLQIETTNKKLLKNELTGILESVSIPDNKLVFLASTRIDQNNIADMETVLCDINQALKKMRGDTEEEEAYDLGGMKAFQEKRQRYEISYQKFIENFNAQINVEFEKVFADLMKSLKTKSSIGDTISYIPKAFQSIFYLSSIILFIKEVSIADYSRMLSVFETKFAVFYTELGNILADSLDEKRRSTTMISFNFNADAKNLFINREATISRSKPSVLRRRGHNKLLETLGLSAPSDTTSKPPTPDSSASKSKTTASTPVSVNGLVDTLCNAIQLLNTATSAQHNFMVKFFHLSTKDSDSFQEYITSPIRDRVYKFTNSSTSNIDPMEPNREIADDLYTYMSTMFTECTIAVRKSILDIIKDDYLQIPSFCVFLEGLRNKYAKSNQEYLYNIMNKLNGRLTNTWVTFVETQIQMITTLSLPSSLKDCEVLRSVKAYPAFIRIIEATFSTTPAKLEEYQIYEIVTKNYTDIWKALESKLLKLSKSEIWKLDHNDSADVTFSQVSRRNTNTPSGNNSYLESHLFLLLNYKWLTDELREVVSLDPATRQLIDEARSTELNLYCNLLAKSTEISELINFVDGVEGLIKPDSKSGVVRDIDPSARNAYSQAVLSKILQNFEGSNLSKTIKEVSNILKEEIMGHTYSSDISENEMSIGIAKEIEADLFNSALTVLSVIYSSTFSRLSSITDKYYKGIEITVDKSVISYTFQKENI